jgi:hypothetical protein
VVTGEERSLIGQDEIKLVHDFACVETEMAGQAPALEEDAKQPGLPETATPLQSIDGLAPGSYVVTSEGIQEESDEHRTSPVKPEPLTQEQGQKWIEAGAEAGVKLYPWVCLRCGDGFLARAMWDAHMKTHGEACEPAEVTLDGATFWVQSGATTGAALVKAFRVAELWVPGEDGRELALLDDVFHLGDADMEDVFFSANSTPPSKSVSCQLCGADVGTFAGLAAHATNCPKTRNKYPLTKHLRIIRQQENERAVDQCEEAAIKDYPEDEAGIRQIAQKRRVKLAEISKVSAAKYKPLPATVTTSTASWLDRAKAEIQSQNYVAQIDEVAKRLLAEAPTDEDKKSLDVFVTGWKSMKPPAKAYNAKEKKTKAPKAEKRAEAAQ